MSGTITTPRGINKKVVIGRQADLGTIATAGGTSEYLRRVNLNLDLSRDSITSQEVNPTQQVRFMAGTTRRVNGTLSGELSPGAYSRLWENLLRKTFVTGATVTATTISAAASTLTISGNSWLTLGFKVGDVVRCTGWTTTATANNNINLQIVALTATVMTFRNTGQEVLIAKTAGDNVTVAVVGKKSFVAATGQADLYETIEVLYDDLSPKISERFTGIKCVGARVNMPAAGLCTVEFQLVGRDKLTGAAAYFTSPSALNAQPVCNSVNGKVRLNGSDVATVTSMQLQIGTGVDAGPVMGQNLIPQIAIGTLSATGSMSCYMESSNAFYDLFDQETEFELHVFLESNGTLNAPFIVFSMPRVRMSSAAKSDSDRAIMQSVSFTALENISGGTGVASEATTISIQDSAA